MEKTIYSEDYQRLCRMLKARRVFLGLRQTEVAERLETSQTFISNYEKGERRLDIVELDRICTALETDLVRFITEFKAENSSSA